MGKEKSLVEQHLEFCYIIVVLSCTVAHVFQCSMLHCSVLNSPAPLTQNQTQISFPVTFCVGAQSQEWVDKKTGSNQIHIFPLVTKYGACVTSWKQRWGSKQPSSAILITSETWECSWRVGVCRLPDFPVTVWQETTIAGGCSRFISIFRCVM